MTDEAMPLTVEPGVRGVCVPPLRDAFGRRILGGHGVVVGVFAKVDGMRKTGSAEEAAPFVALTGAARKVTKFWRPGDP